MFVPPTLSSQLWFPNPDSACERGTLNGLVAVGGDLSPDRLLLAYRSGIFPWSVAPVTWWSPNPRAIIELDHFHVSRSLARRLRRQTYEITFNHAFRQVMEQCAEPSPGRESSWITPEFIEAYAALHQRGAAHSVEAWLDNRLVGGIYGVAIGGFFAGESMFHRAPDASKVAAHSLVEHLQHRKFSLFDIQLVNPHTKQLGAIEIPRPLYLERLAEAISQQRSF